MKLQGLKFFRPLQKTLAQLRQQHAHHNRTLHYDEYLILLLLQFYNPVLQSLRALIKVSDSRLAQRNLGLHHTSLGSLSEASHVFDPEPLRQIFLDLADKATAADAPRRPTGVPEDLKILVADASLWNVLPRMVRHFYQGPLTRRRKGGFKGHFVFNVLKGVPCDVAWTGDEVDERHILPQQIEAGALYLVDRGYCSSALYQSLLKQGASFVVRLRRDIGYQVLQTHALSESAKKAGVFSDQEVQLNNMPQPLRILIVRQTTQAPRNLHPKRKGGKQGSYERDQPLEQEWILLTDRRDLEAELVAQMYRYRWQIETFFRWFKTTLQCQHLLAESENGLALQFYAALIASLLVVIHTGRKPTKGLLVVLHLYLTGWTDWSQVEGEIARCPPAKP